MATLASITGSGRVFAVNAQGVQRALKEGDHLQKGESIRTVGSVHVDLLMDDGELLHVNPDQVVKIDDNVFQTEQTPTIADAAVILSATTETIIQALNAGTDLSTALDATALGLGDGGGGDGATFVQLARIAEGVNGNSYGYDFSSLGISPVVVGVGQSVATAASATASITIDPIGGDGVINNTESQSATTPIKGTVVSDTGGVKAGDTVTITVNGHTYSAPVEAAGGVLTYDTSHNALDQQVLTSDLIAGGRVDVSITLANAGGTAGATATSYEPVVSDFKSNATISVDPVGDNVITPAELHNSPVTTISGTVGGDAKLGDAVTVTVNGHDYQTTVTQGVAGLIYSVGQVLTSDLVADKTIEARVTTSDAFGNSNPSDPFFRELQGSSVATSDPHTSVTEDANVTGGETLKANGQVTFDSTSNLTDAVVAGNLTPKTSVDGQGGQSVAPVGTLTLHADGSYEFSVNNNTVQSLAQDDSVVQTYEAVSADGTAVSLITVTIHGTNDAPVVSAAVTGVATEGATVSTLDALAHASDPDTTVSAIALSVTGVPSALPAGVSYDAATHSFTLDPTNPAFEHLAKGDTSTVTVSYEVSDGIASTPATVSWTVTGTNDAPVVTGGNTSGSLVVTEHEEGDRSDRSIEGSMGFEHQHDFQVTSAGAHGDLHFDKEGHWTYTLHKNETSGAFTEKFTVESTDGAGQKYLQEVRIEGKKGDDDKYDLQINDRPQTFGHLIASDVDDRDTLSYTAAATSSNHHGSLTIDGSGNWTYTLGADENIEHATQDTFLVTVTDSHGALDTQLVTIELSRADDKSKTVSGDYGDHSSSDKALSGGEGHNEYRWGEHSSNATEVDHISNFKKSDTLDIKDLLQSDHDEAHLEKYLKFELVDDNGVNKLSLLVSHDGKVGSGAGHADDERIVLDNISGDANLGAAKRHLETSLGLQAGDDSDHALLKKLIAAGNLHTDA